VPCEKEYKREYYVKNVNKIRAKTVAWREANRDRKISNDRSYYWRTSEERRRKAREYQKKNAKKLARRGMKWRDNNLERQRETEARYRAGNRAACNERIREWKSRNRPKLVIYTAIRGRTTRLATPPWADSAKIRAIYEQAANMRRETGLDWHVDHIVPLINDSVCGLHCEMNLRIIPAEENIKKSNRHWPDMP